MSTLAQENPATQKLLSKIVAKTWVDEKFRSQFISNTNDVLEENGLTIPSDVKFQVINNTLVGTLISNIPDQEGDVVCEISLPSKPIELMDQPIQSWHNGSNSNYPVSNCDVDSCRYCY